MTLFGAVSKDYLPSDEGVFDGASALPFCEDDAMAGGERTVQDLFVRSTKHEG